MEKGKLNACCHQTIVIKFNYREWGHCLMHSKTVTTRDRGYNVTFLCSVHSPVIYNYLNPEELLFIMLKSDKRHSGLAVITSSKYEMWFKRSIVPVYLLLNQIYRKRIISSFLVKIKKVTVNKSSPAISSSSLSL